MQGFLPNPGVVLLAVHDVLLVSIPLSRHKSRCYDLSFGRCSLEGDKGGCAPGYRDTGSSHGRPPDTGQFLEARNSAAAGRGVVSSHLLRETLTGEGHWAFTTRLYFIDVDDFGLKVAKKNLKVNVPWNLTPNTL